MSIPNVKDLQEVTNLLEQIDSAKAMIKNLEEELEQVQKEYQARQESEKNRIVEDSKNALNLKQIQEEIGDIRKQESDLRSTVSTKIQKAVAKFFDDGSFANFVKELIEKLQKNKEKFEIVVGDGASKYIPKSLKTKKGEKGQLRLIFEIKDYILDPEQIQKNLAEKLLTQLLPDN